MVLTRFLTNPSGAKTPPGFSIAKLPGVAKGHTDVRILFLLWAWRWLRFFKTCTVGIRIYQVCLKMKDEPHRYNVYTVYIMYIYIYSILWENEKKPLDFDVRVPTEFSGKLMQEEGPNPTWGRVLATFMSNNLGSSYMGKEVAFLPSLSIFDRYVWLNIYIIY